jgi:hypothetical protein
VTSYANVCFKVSSPRVRAKSDGVGTNQADGMPMRWELAFANERSIRGPLHIQCNGYGDSGDIKQLVDQVPTWPHIEPSSTSVSPPDTIRIRLADIATDKPSAFLTPRGVWPGTRQSSHNISCFATGMCSLGDRPRVGRAALSCICWLNAGWYGSRLCAKGRTGARSLPSPFLSVLPFCVQFCSPGRGKLEGLNPKCVNINFG